MSANHLIYAMLTHRGRVRHGNEDTCAAAPEAGAFVVEVNPEATPATRLCDLSVRAPSGVFLPLVAARL